MLRRILVTFDIDGTLLLADPKRIVQLNSILHAYKEFFGHPIKGDSTFMDNFQFMYHGITDSASVQSLFIRKNYPFKQKDVQQFLHYYDEYFIKQNLGPIIELPGVRKCIKTLNKMENVSVTIASGSTEKTAIFKLKSIDLYKEIHPFCGGFGDKNTLRQNCILAAKTLTENRIQAKIDNVIHIGDTPGDVMSAVFAHTTPIAVETGQYHKKDFPHFSTIIPNMKVGLETIVEMIKKLQSAKMK